MLGSWLLAAAAFTLVSATEAHDAPPGEPSTIAPATLPPCPRNFFASALSTKPPLSHLTLASTMRTQWASRWSAARQMGCRCCRQRDASGPTGVYTSRKAAYSLGCSASASMKVPPSRWPHSAISPSVGIAFADASRMMASKKSSNVRCSSLTRDLGVDSLATRMRLHVKMSAPSRCGSFASKASKSPHMRIKSSYAMCLEEPHASPMWPSPNE
mmetsp:Transcript_48768/g.135311  ORF Transcript_48768/g.135311 Transcript_48768/m.135311 type:complete len:214 (+) Transcript_48768:378-1019(+)